MAAPRVIEQHLCRSIGPESEPRVSLRIPSRAVSSPLVRGEGQELFGLPGELPAMQQPVRVRTVPGGPRETTSTLTAVRVQVWNQA